MQKSLYVTAIILVLSLLFVGAVVASFDDMGNPNNPNNNERANACYVGGSMEGKCTTEAEWQGGWYLIRYEYGLISRQSIPAWAEWVLPVVPVIPTATPTPGVS